MKGSAGVMAAAVAALVCLVGLAAVGAASLASAKLEAQTAADAAALAAAAAAPGTASREAGRLARANGARLEWCRCQVGAGTRRVEVGVSIVRVVPVFGRVAVRASAAAEGVPSMAG